MADLTDSGHLDSEVFPLLGLPRELRDMMYGYMLVRERITIWAGYCWHTENYRNGHDLIVRNRERSTYKCTLTTGMPLASYEEYKAPSQRHHNCPNLNIFLTSRRVYDEASLIYYNKNHFFFDSPYEIRESMSVSVCHAFLIDRPLRSLQRLRSIGLMIRNPSLMSPVADALDDDVLVRLTQFMRGKMSLRHLALTIVGWPPDIHTIPWAWAGKDGVLDIRPRNWFGAFTLLDNLRSLEITLKTSDHEDYDRLVRFAAFLRSSMLINGAALGTENIHTYRRHSISAFLMENTGSRETYQRIASRLCVVQCHDNQGGKSLLPPKAHPSPAFPGMKATSNQRQPGISDVEAFVEGMAAMSGPVPEYLDYDFSDDGDNDSLLSVDVDHTNLGYVRDDSYFNNFHGNGKRAEMYARNLR